MAFNVKVEVTGIDELVKSFTKSPAVVRKYANEAIKKSVFTLLANARINTPVDRGFLRGAAMVTSFEDFKGMLKNQAPYAIYVHEGTRPHYVSTKAIEGWANRKGIPPWAVRRAIMTKGTKAQPFFNDSVEASQEEVQKFFNQAAQSVVKELYK
jgi:HK97 gp10 family phage protein